MSTDKTTERKPVPVPGETLPNGVTVININEDVVHYTREGKDYEFEAPLSIWDIIAADKNTQRQWASVVQVKASRAALKAPPMAEE